MPYRAPIVAAVDSKGYLRCIECHERLETPLGPDGVIWRADNAALFPFECDVCHAPFLPASNRPHWYSKNGVPLEYEHVD